MWNESDHGLDRVNHLLCTCNEDDEALADKISGAHDFSANALCLLPGRHFSG
jgi:hypothetical protein